MALGSAVRIGPERLEFHPFGYERTDELSILCSELPSQFLKLGLLLRCQIGELAGASLFLAMHSAKTGTVTRARGLANAMATPNNITAAKPEITNNFFIRLTSCNVVLFD